ncbi:MAG: hypothetical protein ACNS62_09270 [Candidatus Cyclobacteriaceae bacterium M3_2C_046]
MARANKFGTFGGVFTPSILTILGVIMYLRLPMIVGEAGLWATLGIIIIAHLISFTTGLSVSSIATDKKVEAGGTYYMISRSLGLPIGGTLGLALFVGLSFSVSLYLIGFSESFLSFWELPVNKDAIRITGSLILMLVTLLTFFSTSLAIKTQYFIMVAIILSLISVLFGRHDYVPELPNFSGTGAASLMVLFGIFFPAVTGFEAGVSMSGDLQNPKKSIPTGSISAIVVGFLVYIGLAFFFAYTVNESLLAGDSQVLLKISWVPELVIAGIWGATLSSALGSILGAPRILQATAVDRITSRFFAKGYGPSNEPRNALLLTFAIAEAGILIGELDVIARIVSIFFITTYGFLNLSCAFESWTSADFRPEFKTPVWLSFIGAIACFIVMLELDFLAMMGATIILGMVYFFLKRKELSLAGGDAWSGVWSSLVKSGLKKLSVQKIHTRNWRPNVIMFHGEAREHLVEVGRAITGRLGMLSGFELIESDAQLLAKPQNDLSGKDPMDGYFVHKYYCRNIYQGMDEISRIYGFSGVEPNSILMGWTRNPKNQEKFVQLVKSFRKNQFNSIFLHYNRQRRYGQYRTIDLWWSGQGRNLAFAVNILRHVTYTNQWKNAKIRLLVINPDDTYAENIYKNLQNILDTYRIQMGLKVINNSIEKAHWLEIIRNYSKNSDLVLLGIQDKHYHSLEKTMEEIDRILPDLGSVLMLNASDAFEVYDLGFEKTAKPKAVVLKKDADETDQLSLPEIKPAKYSIIVNDVIKIDQNYQKVLEILNQKALIPYFAEFSEMIDQLSQQVDAVSGALYRSLSFRDVYRQQKTILKIRNDFFFHTKKNLESLKDQTLFVQKEALKNSLAWYIQKLNGDMKAFPARIKIKYLSQDFKINKDEPWRLKWFKLKRKAFNLFSRDAISGYINYREIAQYYLKNNRQVFLSTILNDLKNNTNSFLNLYKDFILNFEQVFRELELEAAQRRLDESGLSKRFQEVHDLLDDMQKYVTRLQNGYYKRFQIEFRQNLQLFSNDLEKININSIIRKKRRSRKYYRQLEDNNALYPEFIYDQLLLMVNKIYLDVLLRSTRFRVSDELNQLKAEMSQMMNQKVLHPLDHLKEEVENGLSSLKEMDGTLDQVRQFNIVYVYSDRQKEILKIIGELPLELTIADNLSNDDVSRDKAQEYEPMIIQVGRVMAHFLESQFFSPVQDHLEKSNETLRGLMLSVKDQLRMARFNYENIDPDLDDQKTTSLKLQMELLQQLNEDQEKVMFLKNELIKRMDEHFEEAFQPVSSAFMIASTAREFSQFLRNYQSKRVITTVGSTSLKFRGILKNRLARVMYSKSEGILLAKKITETSSDLTYNGRLLDLVEALSPNPLILEQLPHFYKNLFSGRSSIGQDFWIRRSQEEALFKKAVLRYQSGISGGILVLAERNAGKTTFCRYCASKFFKNEKIYHLFPPKNGSTDTEVFIRELQKSTGIQGSLDEIMRLQQNAVFIVHDLELWWERVESGGKVLELIMSMMENYQQQCLIVLNLNPYSYFLINQLYGLHAHLIEVIRLRPFDAEKLKNLVMLRHQSSGLQLVYNHRLEQYISELNMARLFNSYFEFSQGNPGVVLNTWLSSIRQIEGKKIEIGFPEEPDMNMLENINDEWLIILTQMLLHKRLSQEKLERIGGWAASQLLIHLNALKRAGLIQETIPGVYAINIFIEPFVVQVLKKKELI